MFNTYYITRSKAKTSTETKLPPDPSATQIARINELSKTARATWLSLLGYLAFVGVTLLGVEDADFFVASRQTQLPLINISIPTREFFLFAPILGTALYAYLHFYLLKLWHAIQAPEPTYQGQPLSDHIAPWLIADMALLLRFDTSRRDLPLNWLSALVTFMLVFVAGPLVIGAFWWRYWPAHEEWNTLIIGLAFALSIYIASTSIDACFSERYRLATKQSTSLTAVQLIAIFSFILFTGWMKTEGLWKDDQGWRLFHEDKGIRRIAAPQWLIDAHISSKGSPSPSLALKKAYVVDTQLTETPKDWLACEDAKKDFRKKYSDRQKLDNTAVWSKEIEDEFESEWSRRRSLTTSSVGLLDLTKFDMRQATFQGSFGVGIRFPKEFWLEANIVPSILEGSRFYNSTRCTFFFNSLNLQSTNFEGAKFNGSSLSKVNFKSANLAFSEFNAADLALSNLADADLLEIQAAGANFQGADLSHADLTSSSLQGANFSEARMRNTLFFLAEMEGADFSRSVIKGANLRGVNAVSTIWNNAQVSHVLVHSADFRGSKGLSQEILDNMIGDEKTKLPMSLPNGIKGNPYVWSCWEKAPPNYDNFVNGSHGDSEQGRREANKLFLCSEENPRVKTGTPTALANP